MLESFVFGSYLDLCLKKPGMSLFEWCCCHLFKVNTVSYFGIISLPTLTRPIYQRYKVLDTYHYHDQLTRPTLNFWRDCSGWSALACCLNTGHSTQKTFNHEFEQPSSVSLLNTFKGSLFSLTILFLNESVRKIQQDGDHRWEIGGLY